MLCRDPMTPFSFNLSLLFGRCFYLLCVCCVCRHKLQLLVRLELAAAQVLILRSDDVDAKLERGVRYESQTVCE